jgi:tetratricopeptide (TPR) repeat protein
MSRWPERAGAAEAAADSLKNAVELRPDHSESRYRLGLVLLNAGRATEAIPHLRRALDLSPRMTDAARALGRAYALSGDRARSADMLRLYGALVQQEQEQKRVELPSSLNQATADERMALAEFYVRHHRSQNAITELEVLVRRHPDHAGARRRLEKLYGHARRFQRQYEERRLLKETQ